LLGAASVAAAAAPSAETRYVCTPAQDLVVTRSGNAAFVQFIDRTYELQRKRSSIGEKYISNTAALIIDGPSAVFVAEDRLQLGTCVESDQIASAG
jgi:hypothetical protein